MLDTRIPSTLRARGSIYYSLFVVEYSSKASVGTIYRKLKKEVGSHEG